MASSSHPLPKLGSGLPRFSSGFPCCGKDKAGISMFRSAQVTFGHHAKLHRCLIYLKTWFWRGWDPWFTPTCCCSPGPVSWTPCISRTNKYAMCGGCCCFCKKLQLSQGVTGTPSAASTTPRLGQPIFFVLLSAIGVLMCTENSFGAWLDGFPC